MSDEENDKPIEANNYILGVMDDLTPDIKDAVYWRLRKGKESYGHGLRPQDDTTAWGTKKDSWLEMAEEEIADALIYVLTNYLRLVENETADETSFQITMHCVYVLAQVHHLMHLIPPE
jgi:hypothetical protein